VRLHRIGSAGIQEQPSDRFANLKAATRERDGLGYNPCARGVFGSDAWCWRRTSVRLYRIGSAGIQEQPSDRFANLKAATRERDALGYNPSARGGRIWCR